MNVLLIAQCDKRALTESRRILDQFAERRGDRTWQTPITQQGLDTLHRLLRKTARKNTAVACHWIRGLNHTELLWVVGDRSRFNEQGAVPTNTTRRNVLRQNDENNWHSGELIRLLVDLAGLLHDLGKAIQAFQDRLQAGTRGALFGQKNLIRHEWVSMRLFEAFVGTDDDADWLARLANPTTKDDQRWIGGLHCDGLGGAMDSPFKSLQKAPLAQALAWLVVTHHRLPELPQKADFQVAAMPEFLNQMRPAWIERAFNAEDQKALKPYWTFPYGLPVTTDEWRQRASRIARRLSTLITKEKEKLILDPLSNPFVMHLSRLSLMLADHHYSSLQGKHAERVTVQSTNRLVANTLRDGSINQFLDEHLLGVAQHGSEIARFLPEFANHLPRLGHHKVLKQRTKDEHFRWQDKSADVALSMRERSLQHGAFIVNMASTGCGKTLGNARIVYALSDPGTGMRCAFAMGLRTLTLQTGKAFKQMLKLDDDDIAIRVGGAANRALFEHYEQMAEATGSASTQNLLDEDTYVKFDGATDQHPLLRRAVADPQVRKLLLAPILVCTIDHLTPATESQRGGRQIAPMLRLLSGDLVLDEPDDFDLNDLPALTRLVHWAGLLGSRVLLSSATLPPALVQGLFEAYCNGRQYFQRNCGDPAIAQAPPKVCCAWVDEFHQSQQDCVDANSFEKAHAHFAKHRHAALTSLASESRRLAALLPVTGFKDIKSKDLIALAAAFAALVLPAAQDLHKRHHSIDPRSGKRVSFGLIRMANIEPLFEVALAMFKQGGAPNLQIHLCVYHARHPLLVRSVIEAQLDSTLNRHDPDAVFALPAIRQRLDAAEAAVDQLFIVLGSPVTEVGRDHDYDWAIVEPSSMRSLIQLAGRVRRHRTGAALTPNVIILKTNLRHYRYPGKAAFCKPGFETDDKPFRLASHNLEKLLRSEEFDILDARPRIVSPETRDLQPSERWVDLEHARMRTTMLMQHAAPPAQVGSRSRASVEATDTTLNASTWWQQAPQDALLTAVLPQLQPFRQQSGLPDVTLVFLPDEDGEDIRLHQVLKENKSDKTTLYVEIDRSQCQHLDDAMVCGSGIEPWGVTNYLDALKELAQELDMPPLECARRFGLVSVRPNENGWRYQSVLGFSQRRL